MVWGVPEHQGHIDKHRMCIDAKPVRLCTKTSKTFDVYQGVFDSLGIAGPSKLFDARLRTLRHVRGHTRRWGSVHPGAVERWGLCEPAGVVGYVFATRNAQVRQPEPERS